MKLLILNGPNLNLLGNREPSIYGNMSFDDFLTNLKKKYSDITINYFQSNHEGEIIDRLQKSDNIYTGIILNAAAYTHTSLAIQDTIAAINTPVVEVHISNIFKRERIRHTSLIAPVCKGSISGFGLTSYELAVLSFMNA